MTRPSLPQRTRPKRAFAHSTLALAATLALGAGEASAFDIDTGNPDLAIRFDNTVRAQLRSPGRVARFEDRQLGALRRRRLQLRQGRRGRQADRPAVRVRRHLQEALRPARQRRGVVRRRLRRHQQVQSERAAGRHPQLHRQPVQLDRQAAVRPGRRAPRRLRLRRRRPRRRAGAAPSSAGTRSTGASRCCSAATCTASRTRRRRSTCRRASRPPAPKSRNCSGR